MLDVLHTPGHTPEHLTFLVTDGAVADRIGDVAGSSGRRIEPEQEEAVGRVFDLCRQDVAGYQDYARQIVRLFGRGAPILAEVGRTQRDVVEAERRACGRHDQRDAREAKGAQRRDVAVGVHAGHEDQRRAGNEPPSISPPGFLYVLR